MEKANVLKERLKNTNIRLDRLYREQRDLLIEYIMENKKLFVTDHITTDENGNYKLTADIEDIDYFVVEYICSNSKGEVDTIFLKGIGLEYDEEFYEINMLYVDKDNETKILCGNFDCICESSYNPIIEMLTSFN